MEKRQAEIDRDRCVACGACCKVCPREALTIFKGCYAVVDGVRCVGCRKCAAVCPASAVIIREGSR